MQHIAKRVLVTIGVLSSIAVAAEAQSTPPEAACPMPVLGADVAGTMPTFMPDSSVHYFIRVMPAMCRNPLATVPRGAIAAAHGPIKLTPEQAERALLWFERARKASGATTQSPPRSP